MEICDASFHCSIYEFRQIAEISAELPCDASHYDGKCNFSVNSFSGVESIQLSPFLTKLFRANVE
jgi:hypothetical protein